jgi:hypothetical protein
MRDHDQPPAGAVRLSEALDPQLVEAVRQARERLAVVQAAVPPQPSWFDGVPLEAVKAWEHSPAVRAEAPARDEVNRAWRAAAYDRQARLINGEWLAWGREDNPWGRWRAIPPDAWNTLVVINEQGGIVRGPRSAAARLYGVVLAPAQRQEMAVVQQSSKVDEAVSAGRRRRNAQEDALRKNRVEAVLAPAKMLWPDRGARPPTTEMVKELIRREKAQDFAPDTLRKILSGTYGSATRLSISLDW